VSLIHILIQANCYVSRRASDAKGGELGGFRTQCIYVDFRQMFHRTAFAIFWAGREGENLKSCGSGSSRTSSRGQCALSCLSIGAVTHSGGKVMARLFWCVLGVRSIWKLLGGWK
jgi:hypothetical protein